MSGRTAFPALPQRNTDKPAMELFDWARRLLDFLKPTLPDLEYKTISTVGDFPLYVQTRVNAPVEVRRCQTYEARNTSAAVSDVSIAWRISSDPRQPGIFITDMGGITAGTDYTIVLAIQGERQ